MILCIVNVLLLAVVAIWLVRGSDFDNKDANASVLMDILERKHNGSGD